MCLVIFESISEQFLVVSGDEHSEGFFGRKFGLSIFHKYLYRLSIGPDQFRGEKRRDEDDTFLSRGFSLFNFDPPIEVRGRSNLLLLSTLWKKVGCQNVLIIISWTVRGRRSELFTLLRVPIPTR